MKRTTYIMITALLGGLLLLVGGMFYIRICWSGPHDDLYYVLKGDSVTQPLPHCKVIRLLTPEPQWETVKEGVTTVSWHPFFVHSQLDVRPSDTEQATLTMAESLLRFTSFTVKGDTLEVLIAIRPEDVDEPFRSESRMLVQTLPMTLAIPTGVEQVENYINGSRISCRDLKREALAVACNGSVGVYDCDLQTLQVGRTAEFAFKSGKIENLYLDLDDVRRWSVTLPAAQVGTEYLTGSCKHHNQLQKGECRRVVWQPRTEDCEMVLTLRQPASVTLTE